MSDQLEDLVKCISVDMVIVSENLQRAHLPVNCVFWNLLCRHCNDSCLLEQFMYA
jgi:hypothetical protein